MTIQIRTTGALFAGVLLMSAVLPGTAFAVDGQIAITQARAMAGGVTPGDAPGFPISINQPGSYVLSGILTVPNADTTAIEITASHVTLDFNGFAILGPTDCSGGLNPCAGEGSGFGIRWAGGSLFNITIRNGTIQGMGAGGIELLGDSHLVEYMHVRSNGGSGITIIQSPDSGSSIVQHSTAQRNSGTGIAVTKGIASHNVADVNAGAGISVGGGGGGVASNNVVTRNNVGLQVFDASYIGNVLFGNNLNVAGGLNLGQNMCNNVVCPGAQF
jgi:hypothetical protein